MVSRFAERVAWITRWLVGLSAGLMSTVIVTEVIMRYVFQRSIFIAEELARLSFVWAGFLAVSLALRAGIHVSVKLVVDRLPRTTRRIVVLISQFITLTFLVSVFISGVTILPHQWHQLTPTMEIQMFWFYLPIPVGVGFMIIQLLPYIEKTLRGEL
jgi:C4-dicarboxylate transporter DctQ subunit